MPAILDRLVKQIMAQGKNESSAFAIAKSALWKSGNLKKGTIIATRKGIERGKMTPGQRAIDRASKRSGKPKSKYIYNPSTNRATLKKSKKLSLYV